MINWSTDEKDFKNKNPQEYRLWRLTQLINYGLDGEKLDKKEVIAAWPKIKAQLDPHKAVYLQYLLWDKKPSSLQFNDDFWTLSKPKTI
ncbi:hypothetical protein A3D85_00485 [Candidatus Amesbacteria bacterium RIFCSPHIGHO2_02_FULL_47_9]|uniref:Uncharacterized protein n=1 Tax=Candidatus Amesbacteria bacterium RIFCSPHIGHO2_01_FULL_48_32b TaxID=1797253 RepID=A0A1F4YDX9_9BACT|nr:MAG: hypothetical protein A2876_01675 [Candidatus Amesbacteria bacterium RIFCSPHIGHO2_01_FULL_48_32b]OGD04901.1 MAG: hypothetical protein A3D85_00485 [Candidatus Amesbacteria bacterium RIFCSPHIGHO2_02_FULL_47_9]OGD07274.1 MAG: hypothetical protein A2899_04695 [Candidatus Amesbacteria bacterium RIFCSPLOWO2_01_FULL_49_25]